MAPYGPSSPILQLLLLLQNLNGYLNVVASTHIFDFLFGGAKGPRSFRIAERYNILSLASKSHSCKETSLRGIKKKQLVLTR